MREMLRMGITVHMGPPYTEYEIVCPDGTELADYFGAPMLTVLASDFMDNFFRCALVARANKCEPMACTACDECQIVSSSWGTASKQKKCMMTSRCDGILERLRMFDLVMPKRRRKKKVA